jgi:hypothetical protein
MANKLQKVKGIAGECQPLHFFYTMHMRMSKRWQSDYSNNKSFAFISLDTELVSGLYLAIKWSTEIRFKLVHVENVFFSENIELIFAIESAVNFDPQWFENEFKNGIKTAKANGKRSRVKRRGLVVARSTDAELQHLKRFGVNPCTFCGELNVRTAIRSD